MALLYKDKWLLDLLQSSFKLFSFFLHIFRPLVSLVLEHGYSLSVGHTDFIKNSQYSNEVKQLLSIKNEDEKET